MPVPVRLPQATDPPVWRFTAGRAILGALRRRMQAHACRSWTKFDTCNESPLHTRAGRNRFNVGPGQAEHGERFREVGF
jgi:hypothetical protein